MSEYLESSIEGAAVAYAKARGWLVRKLKWIGRDGAPDRIFFRDGRCVLIEFKRPKGPVRPAQAREIRRLRKHVIEVHLIDNIDDARAVLK